MAVASQRAETVELVSSLRGNLHGGLSNCIAGGSCGCVHGNSTSVWPHGTV